MKIGAVIITTAAAVAMVAMLAGGYAAPEATQRTGNLQIMVTDAPPDQNVTSIMITVESVEVHKAAAEQEHKQEQEREQVQGKNQTQEQEHSGANSTNGEAGWLPLDMLAGNETFDLLQIQGIEQVVAIAELEPGNYTQIRMTISNVQVRLGDGDLQDVVLPSGKLRFVRPFSIAEGQTTALLFDFDAEKSVNISGSGKIIVNPVVKMSMTTPQTIRSTTKHVRIVTPSLPNGALNVSYDATLMADGGVSPYTWAITKGTLPAGLNLDSASGAISGVPPAGGDFAFTVKVSDNSTPVKSDTQRYTITIADTAGLVITTMTAPDGVVETVYNVTVLASGGATPYTWSIARGHLPDGLTIDAVSGVIWGTPTKSGNYNFTVQVSDNAVPANTDTQRLRIRITKD
jgi:hypothetical protein